MEAYYSNEIKEQIIKTIHDKGPIFKSNLLRYVTVCMADDRESSLYAFVRTALIVKAKFDELVGEGLIEFIPGKPLRFGDRYYVEILIKAGREGGI